MPILGEAPVSPTWRTAGKVGSPARTDCRFRVAFSSCRIASNNWTFIRPRLLSPYIARRYMLFLTKE